MKKVIKSDKFKLIILVILLIGLIVSLILVQRQQILKSKADIDVSSAFSIYGNQGELIKCGGNVCETEADEVTIEVTDPNVFLQE